MKIYFISFLFISSLIYSQTSGSVKYNFYYPMDVENLKTADAKDLAVKIIDFANKQEFQLTFNNQQSKFVCIEKLNFESEFDKKLNNIAKSGFTSHDVYIDFANNTQTTIMNDGTLVESKAEKLNWEIATESKTIGEYLCYKAVLKIPFIDKHGESKTEEIIAWFAPALPFSFGPKSFYGLPGLILEFSQNQRTFIASKIELADKEIKIDFPKGKTIPKEEYEKKLKQGLDAVIKNKD